MTSEWRLQILSTHPEPDLTPELLCLVFPRGRGDRALFMVLKVI